MKKLMLATALFLCVNMHSQIKNLKELLEVSALSVEELTENLQGVWEILTPTEQYTKDRKRIVGRYTYAYNKIEQVLQRQITVSVEYDFRQERTNFICKDQELLKMLITNLPYQGFVVKEKKPHKTVYHDGRTMIAITDAEYPEEPLAKGYYQVTIFMH